MLLEWNSFICRKLTECGEQIQKCPGNTACHLSSLLFIQIFFPTTRPNSYIQNQTLGWGYTEAGVERPQLPTELSKISLLQLLIGSLRFPLKPGLCHPAPVFQEDWLVPNLVPPTFPSGCNLSSICCSCIDIRYPITVMGFPGGSVVKNLPAT